MNSDIKIIKSYRKTISIEISKDCSVTVRAPIFCSRRRIEKFLREKAGWIEKTLKKMQSSNIPSRPLNSLEVEELKTDAKNYIPNRVKYFADIMGVTYSGVKITSATKRFGSCSAKNSLCFSLYLMQYDKELIDYVIVHELAHTIHHNHSKDFYRVIEKYLPDFKARQKALKDRGAPINHKLLEEK